MAVNEVPIFIEQIKREFFDKEWSKKEGAIFCYSSPIIKNNIQLLHLIWQSRLQKNLVYYSMKANPNPHVLKEIYPLVDGFDVSSLNELELLRKIEIKGNHITISGPAKTNRMMQLANKIKAKVIHLDSYDEYLQWEKCNLKNEITHKTLRISLDGAAKKLGASMDEIQKIFLSSSSSSFNGIHVYLGRDSFSKKTLREVLDLTLSIKKKYPNFCHDKFALYLGAGLPSASFFQHEHSSLLENFNDCKFPIHIEAGRFIVNTAGVYLAKVLAVKEHSSKHRLVIINGGLQHLAANVSSPVMGLKNVHCEVISRNSQTLKTKYQVYGSLGTRNDLIHPEADLPKDIARGDWILISPCGAYGYTAAANQFISPDPIREFLWNGKNWADISSISEVPYIDSFGSNSETRNNNQPKNEHEHEV